MVVFTRNYIWKFFDLTETYTLKFTLIIYRREWISPATVIYIAYSVCLIFETLSYLNIKINFHFYSSYCQIMEMIQP
jgi:hypothetical protein